MSFENIAVNVGTFSHPALLEGKDIPVYDAACFINTTEGHRLAAAHGVHSAVYKLAKAVWQESRCAA